MQHPKVLVGRSIYNLTERILGEVPHHILATPILATCDNIKVREHVHSIERVVAGAFREHVLYRGVLADLDAAPVAG